MYRINKLKRNVLIMTDEVIFHAPTKHTLDPRMIENSIIIAEERFIVPALGYKWYEEMIAQKNVVVDSTNKAALEAAASTTLEIGDVVNAAEEMEEDNLAIWNRILWKALAECVMITAYPEGFVQFGSSGTVHENPPAGPMISSGVVTPELKSLKWVMDKKMLDRINPLLESMHVWICAQKKETANIYGLYCKDCSCNSDGIPYKRRTDIVDIYSEEDRKRGW